MVSKNSPIFMACRPSGIIAILLAFGIAILLSNNASAADMVLNGGFETGDFTSWSTVSGTAVNSGSAHSGTYGASFTGHTPMYQSDFSINAIYQTIDLTDVDSLSFYYAMSHSISGTGYCRPALFIGGSKVWQGSTSQVSYTLQEYDVSGYSGNTQIGFGVASGTGPGTVDYTIKYDDIIADDSMINIDTKITQFDEPLTSIIVNDENNTGGFPNEYGYRYLTPDVKESKEYTIYLLGEELADGFELLVFADSADVSKLTIDIEDLDSTKTYDVFFDYEPLEQISGVSEIQYDITSFSWHSLELVPVQGVNLYGKVYNATSNTTLADANVSLLQGSTYHNTTTDANGAYSVTNLSSNIPIHVNVTKTGYTHEDFNVTPEWTGNFQMDLYMLPVVTGVHGLVVDDPWHQAINGSTVWLWNATYNTSTTSNITGYYLITGIADGVYTMNASKDGYITSDNINVTVASNTFVQHFILSQSYNLTVTARDSQTGTAIQSFTTTTETESINTTNGSAVFSLGYGLYYVEVAAAGHYPSFGYAFLDEDESLEIELTPTTIHYAPHNVKFTVKTLWGTLYSGVDVNVYLGDAVTPYNLHLNGTTGTDGALTFVLTEDVQYTLTFIDASQSIDESITLYPIETSYPVYIYDTLAPDDEDIESEEVTVSISTAEINDTHAYINVTYTDAMVETTDLNIYINQSDESDPFNQTVITFANLGATSSVTHSFIIDDYPGQAYFINVGATHTTFGDIQRTYSVRFDGMIEDYGFSKIWVWIGVGGMMFVAGMFKASKAEQGALVVCVAGWVFMGLGFFDSLGSQAVTSMKAGLGLATVLAIGANMSKKDRDETV